MKRRGLHSRFTPDQAQGWRRDGLWAEHTLAHYVDRNARQQPDEIGVADESRELTFAELRDMAWSLAGSLAETGLDDESVVAVQLPNVVEAVVTYYALCRLGCVIVPRMMIYRRSEVSDAIDRTGAQCFMTVDEHRGFDHAAMAMELSASCPSLERVVVLGEAPRGAMSLSGVMSGGDPYDGPLPDPDDDQIIIFTSGTTALPKGDARIVNAEVRGLSVEGSGTDLARSWNVFFA